MQNFLAKVNKAHGVTKSPSNICNVQYCIVHSGTFYSLQKGDTALHLASQEGLTEVVEILTCAKADLNIVNKVSALSTQCGIINYCTTGKQDTFR